jgi:hypothetical protein
MLCGKIINECIVESGFSRNLLIDRIENCESWKVNIFCIEILAAEYRYQETADKWATDMPHVFKKQDYFYKIPMRYDYAVVKNSPEWEQIKSAYRDGQFVKDLLIESISEMAYTKFEWFCNNILQLELHHAFSHNLSFIHSDDRLALIKTEKDKERFLFQLYSFDRDDDELDCIRLNTKSDEEEIEGIINFE